MEKVIKLRKLRMIYFKGFKDFEVDFNDRTVISGMNASGKSTIFDAWSWLLFGKDSLGNADFQIKTLDENGNVIEKVEHEVYGEIEINGSITTLKRVLRENWVKPRGQGYEYLKGNETKCFFDDIPLSVTEYQKRVNEIVDENLFKLITNTNYFHSLKKEDRRNILVSLAGDISDSDISNGKYDDIVELLSKSTSEDLKRKILAEKKRINDELKDIPIRIDELKRGMPEAIDFKLIEEKIEAKKSELHEIDKMLSDRQESVKKHIEEANQKRKQIGELRLKQQDIIFKAEMEAEKIANSKNRDFVNYSQFLEDKKEKVNRLSRKISQKEQDIRDVSKKINDLRNKREVLVEKWTQESKKTYIQKKGCLICPLYNHECTDDEAIFKFAQGLTDSEKEFNTLKMKKLEEINAEGLNVKEKIEANNKVLSELEKEIEGLRSEYELALNDYKDFSKMTPVEYKAEPVIKEDIPEWVELEEKINSIHVTEAEQDNSDLTRKKSEVNEEILKLSLELNKKTQIENTFKRIDELTKEQRILSQALAEQEGIEFRLLQFNKLKMEEVDRRVNDKFKYVSFKLFDKTLEGNEYETCETLIDGVPFFTANNAGRINGSLDIINAVCEYHGIYAPIFLDNSESVNEVIDTKSQLILLVVSNDNLTVK